MRITNCLLLYANQLGNILFFKNTFFSQTGTKFMVTNLLEILMNFLEISLEFIF
jgi:hypothetical protein